MKAAGLASRVTYAAVAFLLSGAVAFFYAIRVLPELTRIFPELDADLDGYLIFKLATFAAAAIASSLSLYELTQPGTRPRMRHGRRWRLWIASVVVVLTSLAFSGMGWGWIYDLLFAAWLAYTLAFTFVRYGILDDRKPSTDTLAAYQGRAKG